MNQPQSLARQRASLILWSGAWMATKALAFAAVAFILVAAVAPRMINLHDDLLSWFGPLAYLAALWVVSAGGVITFTDWQKLRKRLDALDETQGTEP